MKLFYSYGLVAAQFVLIMAMFWTVDVGNLNAVFYILVICGIAIGLSALTAMRKSRFQIIPDVSREASLVTNGPYKYIRHPMYSAILLVCLGLLLTDISVVRLLIYGGLFGVLLAKMLYEERLLGDRFKEYRNYIKFSKRIVPFIY